MTTTDIWARIAAAEAKEPSTITHARRFERRARAHGVRLGPMDFRETHVHVTVGVDRHIRIDFDGGTTQSAEYGDRHWRALHDKMHAHYLNIAGRFRRHGDAPAARAALRVCRYDRAEGQSLPA
jgi:hypothetical protein